MNRYKIEHFVFSKVARFKKCKSCFRCEDAGIYHGRGLYKLSVRPSKGAKVHCCSACSPRIDDASHRACEWYEPRWYWNLLQLKGQWGYIIGRWWCEKVRMRIGALRKPVPLLWVDGLNAAGERAPLSDPKCPHCGEMPYSYTQCQFCGQRFLTKERPITIKQ